MSNPGSLVVAEMYKTVMGLPTVQVDYKSSADAVNDLASGALDFFSADPIFGSAMARKGEWRILAISSAERVKAVGDLPTLKEQGVDVDITAWWGVFAPKATPKPVIDQINKWFVEVVGSEKTRTFLAQFGGDALIETPEAGTARMLRDIKNWADYVAHCEDQAAGLTSRVSAQQLRLSALSRLRAGPSLGGTKYDGRQTCPALPCRPTPSISDLAHALSPRRRTRRDARLGAAQEADPVAAAEVGVRAGALVLPRHPRGARSGRRSGRCRARRAAQPRAAQSGSRHQFRNRAHICLRLPDDPAGRESRRRTAIRAHALRVIIDAKGAFSTVNGEKMPMETGDVVLTPGGCWHGHGHDGDRAAYWFDGLDVPVTHLLEPMFFEEHPDKYEKIARVVSDVAVSLHARCDGETARCRARRRRRLSRAAHRARCARHADRCC